MADVKPDWADEIAAKLSETWWLHSDGAGLAAALREAYERGKKDGRNEK